MILSILCVSNLLAQNLAGKVIYVNPGHGGYDSDDRNIAIAPYASGDTLGFWESKSNLDKGAQLRELLQSAGATVYMSRTQNRTADDLSLSRIVEAANSVDADFMISIHSNAGVTNYVLQLYAGVDKNDATTYPTATPHSDESRAICQAIANNLYSNKANVFASSPSVVGDKTYARTAMGWSDGYGVLRGLTVPGCISEGSMHDYIPETYRLMNMDYKWLEAWHFYKSFCQYFEAGDIVSGNIAGTVHDSRNSDQSSYVKISGSKDELLKIEGAKITLSKDNQIVQVYTTDSLNNGFYLFKMLTPGIYTLKAEAQGYVSQDTLVEVRKNETSYLNIMLDLERTTPPQVINYSPDSGLNTPVLCSSKIIFEFNWDVDTGSAIQAFSIVPAVEGKVSFEDSRHRMIFTPNLPLDTSTVYTVKLAKSLRHPGNMEMADDFVFQFLTKNRNRLKIISAYPADRQGVYNVSPTFEFRFDNKVTTATIRDGIAVYDSNGAELTKVSRSFKVNQVDDPYGSCQFKLAQDLTAGENYRIVLNRNIVDADGIDIVDSVVYNFKAIDVKVADKTVVEDFEQSSLINFDSSSSTAGTAGSASKNTSTKLFDTSSCYLAYIFPSSSGGEACYNVASPGKSVSAGNYLGLHVYGDLSGNEVYVVFNSASGTKFIKLADLDFLGWEFIEVNLVDLPAGQSYVFAGLKIVQKGISLNKSGGIYLDNLLEYDKAVNSIQNEKESFQILNNGSSIQIVGLDDLLGLHLYSLTGIKIRNATKGVLDISSLPSGVYILKIELGYREVISKRVAIHL